MTVELKKRTAQGAPAKSAAKQPKRSASKPRPFSRPSRQKAPSTDASKKLRQLSTLIERAHLGHRSEEIEALAKPSIRFALKRVKSPPAEVVSCIGGAPDLAEGVTWPEEARRPLGFVAQISLDQVTDLDLEHALPRGRLLFFAQLDERREDYGERARVLLVDGPPVRVSPPKGAPIAARSVGLLVAEFALSLPYYEDDPITALKLTADERERYHDEVYLSLFPEGPTHLLLGHGSYGTSLSAEGRRFLAQFDADERIEFGEGDEQTLRFYVGSKRAQKSASEGSPPLDDDALERATCTLEQA